MGENLVKGFDAQGNRVLVPLAKVDELAELGGRVASDQEVAQAKVDDKYEKASTASKIAGAVLGVGAINPTVQAWKEGGAAGLSAGTYQGLVRQAIGGLAGKEAGKAYEEHIADLKAGYGGTYKAGEVAGMVGGAAIGSAAGAGAGSLAAKALPSAGISAVGGAVESGVARALGSVAARGVAGRAVTTAAGLGAQGLVEGALYGAGESIGEQMLGDHELAADKIFASAGTGALYGLLGGAALGGLGSLAHSGASAAAKQVGGGLARMAGEVKVGAAAKAVTEGAGETAYRTAGQVERRSVSGAVDEVLSNAAKTETQKGWAYEQAWKAIGGGQGLQSTKFARQAERYFPNGTKDLGEVAIRHGIIDANSGAMTALREGTPAAMLPKIQAASETVGRKIGDLTSSSGASVPSSKLDAVISSIAKPYEAKAGQRHIGRSVREYGDELKSVLGIDAGAETVSVQALLDQRKALDQLVYQESKALDPKMRVQALRDVRSEIENVITGALDDASGKFKGELASEYKTLKKDFHALRLLEETAEDSAARMSKGATFGLSDKLAMLGGMASGGLASSAVYGVGHKVLRERGNAAAAVLLYRMAEMGTITKAIQSVDQQIGRSAKGLLSPSTATAEGGVISSANPAVKASRAAEQVSKLASQPRAIAERVANITRGLSTTAPSVASRVAMNLTRSVAFLQSKLPPQRNVDPLAPQRPIVFTPGDAEKFARYVDAAEDPIGALRDIERGKVTPEAVETLRVLTPSLYRDLQVRTLDAIATQLATGKAVPFESRIKIGTLLGIQAEPSLNPRVRSFLQANVVPPDASSPVGGTMQPSIGGGPARPIKIKSQHSAFDRLAEGGPGRR